MFASPTSLASAGEVLTVFLIPFGGGIPAGVLLAKARGLTWPIMMFLYFISDVILAMVFEPLMLFVARHVRQSKFLQDFFTNYRQMVYRIYPKWHAVAPGPFALVMISFIIDPMTGRTAAYAAGHGFLTGWIIAILGDMITFALLMASTLCLDHALGGNNKMMAAVIIMAAMILVPWLIKRIRQSRLLRRS